MEGNKELFCNGCGKKIISKNNILQEDAVEVVKEWGYFSKKDLETHYFVLCEACYDSIVKNFVIPIEIVEKKEVL
jgi:hypothetical protein